MTILKRKQKVVFSVILYSSNKFREVMDLICLSLSQFCVRVREPKMQYKYAKYLVK